MLTIEKRLEIDAGHRLMNHESRCANVHGHRYAFTIIVSAPDLDAVGRVVDFGVIKERVGGWLNTNWDHKFIGQAGDPILGLLVEAKQPCSIIDRPPTAENLARIVYEVAKEVLPAPLVVVAVRCQETPTSVAEYRP